MASRSHSRRHHTALWQEILTSSIWSEKDTTRIVFITMLASADAEGIVRASVGGLAHLSRVSFEDCAAAIASLSGPDDDSRTKEFDGRRIESVDGGWRLLNFQKYQVAARPPQPTEKRREYLRNYMKDWRKKDRTEEIQKVVEELKLDGIDVQKDNTPSTPEAKFCAELYHRRLTTKWNPKEIKAFKEAHRRGVFTPENMAALKAYYAEEMAKGGDGIHRRDLLVFLNNIDGEIDRALSKCATVTKRPNTHQNNGSSTHPHTAAASAANSGTSNAKHAGKY